jgi:hypothetical protein
MNNDRENNYISLDFTNNIDSVDITNMNDSNNNSFSSDFIVNRLYKCNFYDKEYKFSKYKRIISVDDEGNTITKRNDSIINNTSTNNMEDSNNTNKLIID